MKTYKGGEFEIKDGELVEIGEHYDLNKTQLDAI
jgi:hypothetical protein